MWISSHERTIRSQVQKPSRQNSCAVPAYVLYRFVSCSPSLTAKDASLHTVQIITAHLNRRGRILALCLYLVSFPAVPHCQGRFSPHCPNNHRTSKPCMCSCSVTFCTSGHHRRRPEHCNTQFSTSFSEQFVSQSKANTQRLSIRRPRLIF